MSNASADIAARREGAGTGHPGRPRGAGLAREPGEDPPCARETGDRGSPLRLVPDPDGRRGGAPDAPRPADRLAAAREAARFLPGACRVGSWSAGDVRPGAGASGGAERIDDDASCPVAALHAPGLHDIASPTGQHGALARALGAGGPLVWVQDALSRAELGAIHARGLMRHGLDPSRLIHVRVSRPRDALWAMEEALREGLPVVGELEGDPRALDFTATRRLEARARGADVGCLLVRTGPRARAEGPTGARWRWRVAPHPSAPDPHDERAPGSPRWILDLVRARARSPGRWVVEARDDGDGATHGGAAHCLRVVAALAAGGVAPGHGAPNGGHGGAVLAFRDGRRPRPRRSARA